MKNYLYFYSLEMVNNGEVVGKSSGTFTGNIETAEEYDNVKVAIGEKNHLTKKEAREQIIFIALNKL